jgi:hypothetical protein
MININPTSAATKLTSRICCLVLVGFSLCAASAQGQKPSETPLTNMSVIKLVKAGFKEKTIIAIINSRPNHFKMDTDQLIQLKHNGVSENIIMAMLSLDDDLSNDDDWSNDTFMRGANRGSVDPGSQGSGADIFGNSSGSRSQSSSRGTRGGTDKENNITGSATVRIIRPPAEAGGSPAKLERTPTLNNEAVIRLVEAGFSEGTIIKRIEDSPAEFDLSPARLDELHKRRVTDPIIAAMTAAMEGTSGEAKPNEREK